MAKDTPKNSVKPLRKYKHTSIGRYGRPKNKHRSRTKRYRGQG